MSGVSVVAPGEAEEVGVIYELSVYKDRHGLWCARLELVPNGYLYLSHRDHLQLLDEVDRVVAAFLRQGCAA